MQLPDRIISLAVGENMVKRIAAIEPRVKHGVFLIQEKWSRITFSAPLFYNVFISLL